MAGTQPYGVRDVEKLLRLPKSTIRALVAAGFVSPARGARGMWQFSFQDLIVLRTAQALADANVPPRRITKSMRELRRHLPQSMPLSGLRIGAVADRVVVREGNARWQAETGQYLLEFEGDPAQGSLSVIVARARRIAHDEALRWFEKGWRWKRASRTPPRTRIAARCSPIPSSSMRESTSAACCTRRSGWCRPSACTATRYEACGEDPVLLFNLGVLYDDLDRAPEAVRAYEAALRRRSGAGRRSLQPVAALRKARASQGRAAPHGALPRADRAVEVASSAPRQPSTASTHAAQRSSASASTSASVRPLRAGTWNEWSASSNVASVACVPSAVDDGPQPAEVGELVARPLQEQHRNVDVREMRGALVGRLARGVQREAEEHEPANAGDRRNRLRLRRHATAERLAAREERHIAAIGALPRRTPRARRRAQPSACPAASSRAPCRETGSAAWRRRALRGRRRRPP